MCNKNRSGLFKQTKKKKLKGIYTLILVRGEKARQYSCSTLYHYQKDCLRVNIIIYSLIMNYNRLAGTVPKEVAILIQFDYKTHKKCLGILRVKNDVFKSIYHTILKKSTKFTVLSLFFRYYVIKQIYSLKTKSSII